MEVKRKGPWIRGRHIVQRPNKGGSPSPHESTWLKFPQPSVPLFAGPQHGSSGVIAIVAGNDPGRPPDQKQSKTCNLSVSPSAFCDTAGLHLGFLWAIPTSMLCCYRICCLGWTTAVVERRHSPARSSFASLAIGHLSPDKRKQGIIGVTARAAVQRVAVSGLRTL